MKASQLALFIGRSPLALAVAVLAHACTPKVEAPPHPRPPPVGTVILDWTIDGAKDPASCERMRATSFNVLLVDAATGWATPSVGQWVQDCGAFATTIDGLGPGTYVGRIDLIDAAGSQRTTVVNLLPFHVDPGSASIVAVEFPRSSFL